MPTPSKETPGPYPAIPATVPPVIREDLPDVAASINSQITGSRPVAFTQLQELTEEHQLTPPEAEVLKIVFNNESAAELQEAIYQLRLLARLRYGATLVLCLLCSGLTSCVGLGGALTYDAATNTFTSALTYDASKLIRPTK